MNNKTQHSSITKSALLNTNSKKLRSIYDFIANGFSPEVKFDSRKVKRTYVSAKSKRIPISVEAISILQKHKLYNSRKKFKTFAEILWNKFIKEVKDTTQKKNEPVVFRLPSFSQKLDFQSNREGRMNNKICTDVEDADKCRKFANSKVKYYTCDTLKKK